MGHKRHPRVSDIIETYVIIVIGVILSQNGWGIRINLNRYLTVATSFLAVHLPIPLQMLFVIQLIPPRWLAQASIYPFLFKLLALGHFGKYELNHINDLFLPTPRVKFGKACSFMVKAAVLLVIIEASLLLLGQSEIETKHCQWRNRAHWSGLLHCRQCDFELKTR